MAGGDADRVALVRDDRLTSYDFGPSHPLAPVRVELTYALIDELGLSDLGNVDVVPPGEVDEGELRTVHAADYLAEVRRRSLAPDEGPTWAYGIGPGDTPAFAGMHEASLGVVAASREAARRVLEGEALHAFNPAGGLHHAMPDRAAGFCVYNDPAVAIRWMLAQGAERVAYVDVDVHHGDGVEEAFRGDRRVLTISLHESGRYLFPGTGFPDEVGDPGAEGSVVNLPMLPGTDGGLWLDAFDAVVPDLLHAFAPDVLVTQLGCDTHVTDPLAHLALRVDDQHAAVARLHQLAHEVCEGRWVATGGGGYRLVDVVPRAWAGAFAEMAGVRLPVEVPIPWRVLAHERTGERAPEDFSDDPVRVATDVAERNRTHVDEVVEVLRARVHPHHGLR